MQLSVRYDPVQDRIAVHLQDRQEGAVRIAVLWMTHRLLSRFVARIVELLDRVTRASVRTVPVERIHRIEQRYAAFGRSGAGGGSPSAVVPANSPPSQWLVTAVDVSAGVERFVVTFRSDRESERVVFSIEDLRRFLAMIHESWIAAEWPLSVWPSWISVPRGEPVYFQ